MFDILDTYANSGIKNVELGSYCSSPIDLDLLGSYDFDYLVHNYFPPSEEPIILNLASPSKAILMKSIEHVKKAIKLCVKLGSPLYSVHPGYRQDPDIHFKFDHKKPIIPYNNSFKTFTQSINSVNNFAIDNGVKFAVENNIINTQEFGDITKFCLLYRLEEFKTLFNEIPSSNLGLLLDLGHLNVNSFWLNLDKYDFVDKIKDKVFAIHIHDNDRKQDLHTNINKNSWFLETIKQKFFKDIPLTIESRNLDIDEIIHAKKLIESLKSN